jgi:Fe-S-cluster containining protein
MTRENHDPYAEIDQAFFADGYRLASDNLDGKPTRDLLLKHLKAQYTLIDGLLDAFQQRVIASGGHIDCRRGCSWCCHQPVLVMPAEMVLITAYIRENFDEVTTASILHRATEKDEKVRTLPAEKALQVKMACPLLQDGSCRIYPARPMACRIYLSSNLDSCLREFHHPEKEGVYPELFDFPLHAGRMMNSGLVHYLKEKGMKVYENRLEKILREMLEEPEKENRWLSGAEEFSDGHRQVEEIVRRREKP